MVEGKFIEGLPTIPVTLTWGGQYTTLRATLDTGFSGDVHVSHEIAKELSLPIIGYSIMTLANGETLKIPYARGIAAMEKSGQSMQIHISDGIPPIGIGFLTKFGYTAIVDCRHMKVGLEKI